MSRATSLALFLILLQASIGFVDATELFTVSYLDVPDNNAKYVMLDLEQYASQVDDTSAIDSLMIMADWGIEAFFIGIKVVLTVIFVLPTLITIFGVPVALATFIQVGVYYVYATWYSQYKSGKGWKAYE